MRILLINAEQDERLFATFKHEHILYDQQPESDTLDISENIYDVIVYNATKLDEKTVDAVRSLRESGDMTPLLVMAGHTTARARIRILNAGADNVLMRPCQSDEILAHVNALARRPRMMQSEILTAGDLTLDRGRCVLSSNDGEVRLSGKELQLVEMFLREPGQVLPREMLHEKVWGAGRDATYNNIGLSDTCAPQAACGRIEGRADLRARHRLLSAGSRIRERTYFHGTSFYFSCTDYLGHTRHVGAAPFRAAAFFRCTDPAGVRTA